MRFFWLPIFGIINKTSFNVPFCNIRNEPRNMEKGLDGFGKKFVSKRRDKNLKFAEISFCWSRWMRKGHQQFHEIGNVFGFSSANRTCFRDRQTSLTHRGISKLMPHTAHVRFDRFIQKIPVSYKNPQKSLQIYQKSTEFPWKTQGPQTFPQKPQKVHILWKFPRWWQHYSPCLLSG